MHPSKAITIYGAASIVMLAFARPGYDVFSGIMILIGGASGSMKLFIDSLQDVYYEDLTLGRQFSSEALTVSFFALAIWLIGGVSVFKAARSRWKGGFRAGTILIWIVGSVYNIIWFGIRSL